MAVPRKQSRDEVRGPARKKGGEEHHSKSRRGASIKGVKTVKGISSVSLERNFGKEEKGAGAAGEKDGKEEKQPGR